MLWTILSSVHLSCIKFTFHLFYRLLSLCCVQKRLDGPDASVHLPKFIRVALPDGSFNVLDDRSQVVTNEEFVKVEVAVENSKGLPPDSGFQCSICSLNFSTRGNLTRHFRKFHEAG